VRNIGEIYQQDARLGRFWSVDPLAGKYPWNSPYAFAENRLVDGVEWEGMEVRSSTVFWDRGEGGFVRVVTAKVVIEDQTSGGVPDSYGLVWDAARLFERAVNRASRGTYDSPMWRIQPLLSPDASIKIVFVDEVEQEAAELLLRSKPRNVWGWAFGNWDKGTYFIAVKPGGISRKREDIVRTIAHEVFGHGGGLEHPWEDYQRKAPDVFQPENFGKSLRNALIENELDLFLGESNEAKKGRLILENLMNSGGNPVPILKSSSGTELSPDQVKHLNSTIRLED